MKVLLLYPRMNLRARGSYWDPPLGVLYLATYLRSVGIECNVVDATFMKDWNALKKALPRDEARVVGLSFSSPLAYMGFKAAELIKTSWPDSFVVAGGPHPTVCPGETLDNPFIDAVVLGEGEVALSELVLALCSEKGLKDVPNVWYKTDGKVLQNARTEFVSDLDMLPWPDRKFIDIRKYLEISHTMPIHIMRGCPFKCLFCQPTLEKLFGKKLRFRSPENIVAEMLALRKEYPQKDYVFSFQADTFTAHKKWVLELCEALRAEKLDGTPWVADTRVNLLDKETIIAMKRAGCYSIRFGLESGSMKVLKFLDKGITADESKRALKLCYGNGILPQAYIMIGTPTENKDDLEMTARLIREARPAFINISRTTPVPGSNLYHYAAQQGMINVLGFLDYDYYHNEYPMKLDKLTKEDLDKALGRMMRVWLGSLFLTPSILATLVKVWCRFPAYRFFWIRMIQRSVKVGTLGRFGPSLTVLRSLVQGKPKPHDRLDRAR